MTPIKASDEALVPYPREKVWAVLADVGAYGRWWPADLRVRVLATGSSPIGSEIEIHPVGGRAFQCRVVSVDPPSIMQMQYFGGFIEGSGEWRLEPAGAGTRITYGIDTRARGWLVAILGRFINLGALHSRQMQGVFENLKRKLQKETVGGGG